VGIVASIIISIITDRTHAFPLTIKILTPIVAVSYLAFLFAPTTHQIVAPYIILAVLGASSFALLPVALEYVVEVTYPVSPEVTSTILWATGQLLGGVFTIIMNVLKDDDGLEGNKDYPPGNMQRALVFQAIICCLTAVIPFGLNMPMLGMKGDGRRRYAVDLVEVDAAPGPSTADT
jgi:FLVCR family MFS transporter 7